MENVEGGEWRSIEPTALMDILVYAFVEHGIIPPLSEDFRKSLTNFFSIFMADPIQQVFVSHIKLMYRRGWKKEDLARKACYVLVEHYVALVLLVVQRALLQDNTSLSSTAAFMSNIDSVAPMLKIKDLLLSLVVAFDPISFLQEEINNRSVHEEKFQHHFREYAEYVNEIITSHEMWLQDRVNAFGMVEMSRRELFNRIVSAGGYEESRNNIVHGVVTNVTEADQRKEIQTSGETPNTLIDDGGKEMKKIDITIVNSGTQTMAISEANVKEPIVLVDSPEKTRITVDASHPKVSSLTNDKILSLVRDTIKNEVQLIINKVTIPPRNTNNSNTTETYVAYASEVGELLESELGSSVLKNASTIRYDVDVDASDSASQIDRNNIEPYCSFIFFFNLKKKTRLVYVKYRYKFQKKKR